MRLEPHAIGAARRAAAQRQRGHLGDERQDDDRRDGRRRSSSAAATRLVHNRAGANMAGGVASALLQAARRGTRLSGDTGLFEVDEFWLDRRRRRSCARGRCCSRNLFRDQLDRYGELETIAERWAERRRARTTADARPQRRRPDRRRPRPRPRGVRVFFGVEDDGVALAEMQHAADAKHCRRCGAPYVYDAVYLGHLGRYHCDNCGAHRPEPAVAAHRRRARRRPRRARSRCARPPASGAIALPLPGLYNVYNALGAAALALALGAPLDDVVAGLQAVSPAFGRAETVRLGGPRPVDPARQEPGRAPTRSCARSRSSPASTTCSPSSTTSIADGRDVSWVWDADFERARRARAARDLQRHARGRDGAAAEVRGRADGADRGRDRPRRRRSTAALRHGDGPRCSRSRPTPRCSGCATCSSRAAPRGAASRERRPAAGRARARGHLARRRVRRLRRGPAAVARARRSATPGRCSTSAPAPGAWRSTSPAAGHEVVALDRRRRPARRAARARRPGCRSRPSRADARDFDLGERRFALILVPMQTVQLLGGPDGRAAFLRRARARLAPGGLARDRDRRRARDASTRSDCLPPIPDIREIDGIVYASRAGRRHEGARRRGHPPRPRDGRHRRAPHRRGGPSSASTTSSRATLEAEGRGRGLPRQPRAARSRRPTTTSARRW